MQFEELLNVVYTFVSEKLLPLEYKVSIKSNVTLTTKKLDRLLGTMNY